MDSIGGKNAPAVEAQRKRFDAFVEKAATKEDLEELQREKKRVRFGDQTRHRQKFQQHQKRLLQFQAPAAPTTPAVVQKGAQT